MTTPTYKPRRWTGESIRTYHWWWDDGDRSWQFVRMNLLNFGDIFLPPETIKPTETPPGVIEGCEAIDWDVAGMESSKPCDETPASSGSPLAYAPRRWTGEPIKTPHQWWGTTTNAWHVALRSPLNPEEIFLPPGVRPPESLPDDLQECSEVDWLDGAPEVPEAPDELTAMRERAEKAEAKVVELEAEKTKKSAEFLTEIDRTHKVCLEWRKRGDKAKTRVAALEKRIETSQWVAAEELKKERARVEALVRLVEDMFPKLSTGFDTDDIAVRVVRLTTDQSGEGGP